ncbi:MAG: HD domain-containing protein [Butyrivibrio sp.]|nr:HD domain-containing protein [Butyrivibrio sp.]
MQQVKDKKIKDPIYGYITISQEYIKNVIDTPIFQRLRRILQTSYSPLYASTLHNRFVHSIGVYHLGKMVAKSFERIIIENKYLPKEKAIKYSNAYCLACLLHDVGPAPFSHTGEIYYKNKDCLSIELHKRLCLLVNSTELNEDIPSEMNSAAPHEIMSAIIGIKEFGDIIGDDESKELFARCITGYTYNMTMPTNGDTSDKDIKNCFIGMLNSKVIDVDRLDYLIRDAYTSGFETVNIDYERLLKALTIVIEDGHYVTAYRKNAVSIIENVVYAHDAERKWIHNHPTVLYETYILSHILEHLSANLDTANKKLFSEDSLSVEGQTLKGKTKVSLLCDDDIIYLSKNKYSDKISKEFFDRNSRMHPIWKSEAEYKAYISSQGTEKENSFLDNIINLCNIDKKSNIEHVFIDDALIRDREEELRKLEQERNGQLDPRMKNMNKKRIEIVKGQLQMIRFLQDYAKENMWESELLFIKASMFNSSFKKGHIKNIPIAFGEGEHIQIKKLEDVCSLLDAQKVERDLCYLFYHTKESGKAEEDTGREMYVAEFCKNLVKSLEVHSSEE